MTTQNVAVAPSVRKVELSWDDFATSTFPENPARAAWREAVAEVAANAKQTLPNSHGRIDSAVAIVLGLTLLIFMDAKFLLVV